MDKTDAKILQALSKDSRQSRTKLAKELRISKSTLLYRIALLEQSTIRSYVTIVNQHQNANMCVRIAGKGTVPKQPYMFFYSSVHGAYEVVFSFYARTLIEAQKRIDQLKPNFQQMDVSFALHIHTCFPKAFGLEIMPLKSSYTQHSGVLGEFDARLLYELEKSPLATLTDLSQILQTTPKTVLAHKKSLERKKVIQRYSIVVDPRAFGFELAHIFWSDIGKRNEELISFLLSHPRIAYVTEVFGGKVECEFLIESHKELYSFMREVKSRFGADAESYFVFD